MNEHEKDPHGEYAGWTAPEHEAMGEAAAEIPEQTFRRYKAQLALDEKSLPGKMILDVGSNESKFGKYLEEKYPGTKVVSLDRDHVPGISVQASSEQLPFRNESFDVIVAHAVPLDADEYRKTAEQMIAALRPGGEIRIGPLSQGGEGEYANKLWVSLHTLVNNLEGKKITIEDIATGEWDLPSGPETKFCVVIKKLK